MKLTIYISETKECTTRTQSKLDEVFTIVTAKRIPEKIRNEFHSLSISDAPDLMNRKGLRYVPEIISSTKPYFKGGREGVEIPGVEPVLEAGPRGQENS